MKYRDSGVNIDRANLAKARMAESVKSTWGDEVLSETGAFGGLYALQGYRDPVLVSSIDGVGTKVLVAVKAGRFGSVGQDLVNHCVNDILVQGARPLFFLDYLASGALEPERTAELVRGVATACRENRCALIGGETAEMPGIYDGEDFDMAGCIVGAVERDSIIDGTTIRPGDAVFAFPASGLHTNGYSLARKVIFDLLGLGVHDEVEALGCTVADELLKVHRSYLDAVEALTAKTRVKGLAHITGGGVLENLPRILPDDCDAVIRRGSWQEPAVFGFMQDKGGIPDEEMFRVFNMGLGMIAVVSAEDADQVESSAANDIRRVGEITTGGRAVRVT